MSDGEAALVEAAAIDLLGLGNLTNRVRGQHSGTLGRILASELAMTLAAPPVIIEHKAILITINRLFRSGMSAVELCEATRGVWKIGEKREEVELAMAVYQGVVREVFRIKHWYPAGTLPYATRRLEDVRRAGRWEFDGDVAMDVRTVYVGKSVRGYVGESSQNPIRYVNF
jgi:hypothetical protein